MEGKKNETHIHYVSSNYYYYYYSINAITDKNYPSVCFDVTQDPAFMINELQSFTGGCSFPMLARREHRKLKLDRTLPHK